MLQVLSPKLSIRAGVDKVKEVVDRTTIMYQLVINYYHFFYFTFLKKRCKECTGFFFCLKNRIIGYNLAELGLYDIILIFFKEYPYHLRGTKIVIRFS